MTGNVLIGNMIMRKLPFFIVYNVLFYSVYNACMLLFVFVELE